MRNRSASGASEKKPAPNFLACRAAAGFHVDMDVKEQFAKISAQYDSQRRNLIPDFDGFYGAAADALELPANARIADLGAGTGILAEFIARKFPDAEIELVDISDKMLDIAKKRFAGNPRASFVLSDFASWKPRGKYAAVVSALAIHHIEDFEKKSLFKKIFDALDDGGVFVNAEQILGATPKAIATNAAAREEIMQKFMTPAEAEVARERLKCDRCATLSANLEMLAEAGFAEVGVRFENLDFAVLCAKKFVLQSE